MINISQKQLIIIGIIGGVIILIIGYLIYSKIEDNSYEQFNIISEEQFTNTIENVENEDDEIIVIHIAGQIKKPGIIKIKEGARIADIIEKAGGLTEKANIDNINLAYIVEDGQKIIIPSKEDKEEIETITTENGDGIITDNAQNTSVSKGNTTTSKININNANMEELQTLSGIGEATANKIIEYRKENGNFKTIEDIKNVPGIGNAKYEEIKEKIKVK